ncbi:MAG TPA: DEAD/DEAH box helicase, partial [Nitrososphaera sp.]|nr:DEAD/DEAH box helicase [Nitrososphaera sp.]
MNAVALTHDNVKKDKDIWKKLDEGHYQIVFATPEVLFTPKGHFLEHTMKKLTTFAENLVLLSVDEAHMIFDYQNFRPHYAYLGRLRVAFPNVPIAAFSATFPPPAVSRCQKILGMTTPSDCVTLFGRRYNINILIAEQPSQLDSRPILELLPRRASDLPKMPKIAVFVDDVKVLLHLTYNVRFYVAKLIGGDPDSEENQMFALQFVRTYYSAIQTEKREETEGLVKTGQARIVFATEAMSHGV